MRISPLLVIALVCLAGGGSLLRVVEAIWLTIPWAGDKCIYEDIQANVVVIGDFLCIDRDTEVGLGPTVNIRVTSAYGKEVYKRTNVTQGRFAFTTSESGTYLACLSMYHDQTHYAVDNSTAIVSLDWKMGIRTKDWDDVAKKEKIEGVELELRKSSERIGEIKANIFYLRFREASMREINEKTNKRVAQLSFMSLGISVIVSLLQVWHLKRFFLKKKLI
ncbi:Transmembrane emp24 domain-containing protein p24delta6 [Raphanus sativus]|uniref:Transmembrane emp24 domain-containing protein p24delta6-like n=1 Tax=Raphanus sativus TaxID=3726 RepID=A0A6J0JSA0_RAPSA|nr:transmembrane emp24 domain-containing protein p24delta6-like [Raphanus sativus]KAJ4885832.1 Transmembrane emp24 domain-containing protein p24delta6 [Raphanus sativus]